MTVRTICTSACVLLVSCSLALAQGQRRNRPADTGQQNATNLATYEGRYYVIHTDLERDQAREAEIRMARMAEEYHARTRDFAGNIREKFPFYLFKNEKDYIAAGGKP